MRIKKIIPVNILVPLLVIACNQPHDPEHTLDDIRQRGILKAGVSYNPPFVVSSLHDTTGIDIDLLKEIAHDLQVQLQLTYGSEPEIVHHLEEKELDIIAAGFLNKTPYKKKMGMTTWYFRQHDSSHVFGVTKGENAWVMYLEKFIYAHRDNISQSAKKYLHYENK